MNSIQGSIRVNIVGYTNEVSKAGLDKRVNRRGDLIFELIYFLDKEK